MLKLSYAQKSDIPSGAEGFYSEKDGKFVLKAEIPDVTTLENTLEKERKARREAEAKSKETEAKFSHIPDDLTPEKYKSLVDGSNGSKDLEKALKEQRESIEKVHTKDIEKLKGELSEKETLVTTHVKNAELRKAMAESNIAKAFMPAVEAMMSQKIKVEGMEVFLNEKPVSVALKEWANSDDGKHFVQANANSGGGASSKAGNGSSKKTMPRSEFSQLPHTEQSALSLAGITLTE